MTLIVDLAPETEASLLTQAQAAGLPLDAFVQSVLVRQANAEDPEVDAVFDAVEIADGVGEGSLRRENWYR